MTDDAGDILLSHGADRAVVSRRGAEVISWTVAGRERMWSPDPAVWGRVSPVLFPVCGWTRRGEARVDGVTYPLGLHGFAPDRDFTVEARTPESVTLVLVDDGATRALYPFPFRLAVTVSLGVGSLSLALAVTNPGERPLPYAVGLHPGFVWPGRAQEDGASHLRFEAPERPEVPVIAPGGLVSTRRRPVPVAGRDLPLSQALFAREALCFFGAASRSLRFEQPDAPTLHVTLRDLPNIVLWARPPSPFLCIEGWTGQGDPEGFTGDLADKPDMRHLAPGATARHGMDLRLDA